MSKWIIILLIIVPMHLGLHAQGIKYAEKNKVQQHAACLIENNADYEQDISSLVGSYFFLSDSSVLKFISKMSVPQSLDQDYRKAWYFMTLYTWSARKPLTDSRKARQGLMFFNSVGWGYCGIKSQMLAWLWRNMGYSVRVINLEGHVVPEIFIKDHWEVWDPTYHVFYPGLDGVPMGVDSLAAHPEMINNAKTPADVKKSMWSHLMGKGKNLASFYRTTENNQLLESNVLLRTTDTATGFKLPPHSKMIFPVYSGYPLWSDYQKDISRLYDYAECALFIDSGYIGVVELPLILHAVASEDARFMINGMQYPLNHDWPEHVFTGNQGGSKIRILSNTKGIWVYYLINPQLIQRDPEWSLLSEKPPIEGVKVLTVKPVPRNRVNVILLSDIQHGMHLDKFRKAFFRWISAKK